MRPTAATVAAEDPEIAPNTTQVPTVVIGRLALVAPKSDLVQSTRRREMPPKPMRAWDEGVSFRSLLEKDERVTIGPDALDQAFSLERSLRHIGAVFDALEAVQAPDADSAGVGGPASAG